MTTNKGTHGYLRWFSIPTRCTLWARDKLIAHARSNETCEKLFKRYGGVKYDVEEPHDADFHRHRPDPN